MAKNYWNLKFEWPILNMVPITLILTHTKWSKRPFKQWMGFIFLWTVQGFLYVALKHQQTKTSENNCPHFQPLVEWSSFVSEVSKMGIYSIIYIYIPADLDVRRPWNTPLARFRSFLPGPCLAFGFFLLDKVLRNGLLWYILYTCPNM